MKTTDVLAMASTTVTANGFTQDLVVAALMSLDIDVNISAFSGATNIKITIQRKGIDGVYYDITPTGITNTFTAPGAYSVTLAAQNSASQGFGKNLRVLWAFTSPTSPSATISMSVVGK